DVPDLRSCTPIFGDLHRLPEQLQLLWHRLMAGHVGDGEMRPETDDLDKPFGLGLERCLDQRRPAGAERGTTSTESGIDLEVQPRGPSHLSGRGRDLGDRPWRRRREVDVAGDRL